MVQGIPQAASFVPAQKLALLSTLFFDSRKIFEDLMIIRFHLNAGKDPVICCAVTAYLPYVTGYADGTFRPQNNIKRSECAVMLYRLMEQLSDNAVTGTSAGGFLDVPTEAWVLLISVVFSAIIVRPLNSKPSSSDD